MIPLRLDEIARLAGGRLGEGTDPAATVTAAVVMDSRKVEPGGLFVCEVGEQVDGHDFAGKAHAAGAVAVLATRPVDVPAVLVDDVTSALGRVATGVLERTGCRIVGVTGSSGKTSTKDLLAAMFAAAGPTVAPENSFNNEYGLPLTALRVTGETQTLVLEYSARGIGHIRYLCGIARPDIAVVLNVGEAHLGEFGSRAAIATAKGELVEALAPSGHAVLNADDPLVARMADRTTAPVVTFGQEHPADVRITALEVDALARPRLTLDTPEGLIDLQLALHGRHQAMNAAAALAAAFAAGLPLDAAASALASTSSISPHRMQLRRRDDGLVVIDDAYNANPDSVRAALQALTGITPSGSRCWAVLGPMRELGEESTSLHRQVGVRAAELGVDELVTVGADAAEIAAGATAVPGWAGQARSVPDADAAAEILVDEARPGDVVLVKASNSERLWRLADRLLDEVRASA